MTKNQERLSFWNRAMTAYGISNEDAYALRRIEMTLRSWGERECGDSNDWGSWVIERSEENDKPYMVRHHYRHGNGKDTITRYAIPDREKGALKRLASIMARYPNLLAYHQSDPRGGALYLVRKSDIPAGKDIDGYYTRGVYCNY